MSPAQPDNPLVCVNRAVCRTTGYSDAEVVDSNCRFLAGPRTDPAAVAALRAIRALPPVLQEPDGTVCLLDEGASVLIGAPVSLDRDESARDLPPGADLAGGHLDDDVALLAVRLAP